MEFRLLLAYFCGFLSTSFFSAAFLPWFINKWLEKHAGKANRLASNLEEIFIFIRENRLSVILSILPPLLGWTSFIFFKWIGFAVGFLLGLILPVIIFQFMVAQRKAKFERQLVDGLMILNSCLKGGLSLLQSFETLVEEMSPPISQEFGLVVREIKVGVSTDEALERLNKRMPSEELSLFVSAVLVARETGGDLTKVFSRLVSTLRDRAEIKERTATLTVQGKIQAIIMSLLPVAFIAWVYKIDRHHFDVMFQTDIGRLVILVGVVLYLAGVILLKRFSKVEI